MTRQIRFNAFVEIGNAKLMLEDVSLHPASQMVGCDHEAFIEMLEKTQWKMDENYDWLIHKETGEKIDMADNGCYETGDDYWFFENATRLQFIGVKDKHGKEIYEGDIVITWSAGSKGKFEIKFRQDGAPMWLLYPAWQAGVFWNISATHHTPGKQFIDVSGKIEASNLEGYFDDGIEVIGNIYENPDLKPLRGVV